MKQRIKYFYNRYMYGADLFAMLKGTKTILELGCGEESLLVKHGINKKKRIYAIDIYEPYVEKHLVNNTYHSCICKDILTLDYPADTFDIVVCMDVIEHINKQSVISSGLLDNMKKWANKVIITTPNGYVINHPLDKNNYQNHKSGWYPNELQEYGYRVRGLSGWRGFRREHSEMKYNNPLIVGIALATEPIFYYLPYKSFQIVGTYEQGVYK